MLSQMYLRTVRCILLSYMLLRRLMCIDEHPLVVILVDGELLACVSVLSGRFFITSLPTIYQ